MVNADVVIDVFDSCIHCLSEILNTSVGAWIGGSIVLILVFRFIKSFQNI